VIFIKKPDNSLNPYTHYTKTYQMGGTSVHIIAPDISKEERDMIIERIRKVARILWLKGEARYDS
jgi:hypothetical protein